MNFTAEEIDVMRNLSESAGKAMRSKRMLRILAKLQDKGAIVFDPFAGHAEYTDAGGAALAVSRPHHQPPEK